MSLFVCLLLLLIMFYPSGLCRCWCVEYELIRLVSLTQISLHATAHKAGFSDGSGLRFFSLKSGNASSVKPALWAEPIQCWAVPKASWSYGAVSSIALKVITGTNVKASPLIINFRPKHWNPKWLLCLKSVRLTATFEVSLPPTWW